MDDMDVIKTNGFHANDGGFRRRCMQMRLLCREGQAGTIGEPPFRIAYGQDHRNCPAAEYPSFVAMKIYLFSFTYCIMVFTIGRILFSRLRLYIMKISSKGGVS